MSLSYACVCLRRPTRLSPLMLESGIVFASVTEIIFLLAGGDTVEEVARGIKGVGLWI